MRSQVVTCQYLIAVCVAMTSTLHNKQGKSPDQTGPGVVYIVVVNYELVLVMNVSVVTMGTLP